jgi:hypothetical protein
VRVSFASTDTSPPLAAPICDIVRIGAKKQVRRVYAGSSITLVQDMLADWNVADMYQP